MIKINVENNLYDFPENWDDVSLKKMIDIEYLDKSQLSQMKKTIKLISILTGIEYETLLNINIEDFNKLDLAWMQEKISINDLQNIITIDGKRFGIVKDLKQLSLGEYADLDEYSKSDSKNLHYIAAILIRPIIQEDGDLYIIEKYDSKTLEDRANLFLEKMKLSQILGMSSFFLTSVKF